MTLRNSIYIYNQMGPECIYVEATAFEHTIITADNTAND